MGRFKKARMQLPLRSRLVALFVAAPVAVALACTNQLPPPGELVVSVTTDVSIPKDIDTIRVQVLSNGVTAYDSYFVVAPGSGGLKIPATLGLLAGSDPTAPVLVRVIAISKNKAVILREATVQVPTNRTALLQLPLQWLSEGSAKDPNPMVQGMPDPTTDDIVEATCKTGETSIAGACESDAVETDTLPDYLPALVFGGGDADGGGTCFETIKCFPSAAAAKVDTTGCTVDVPKGADTSKLNVALVPTDGAGICAEGSTKDCFVPLDLDPTEGWTLKGSIIQLPKGLCDVIENGLKASVTVSTGCPSKTLANPTCGPWDADQNGVTDSGTDATVRDSGAASDSSLPEDAPTLDSGPSCSGRAPDTSSPTGTFEGSGTLEAIAEDGGCRIPAVDFSKLVDGYAFALGLGGVYELGIYLTSYAQACGYYANGLSVIGAPAADIQVYSQTPIATGSYDQSQVSASASGLPACKAPGACPSGGSGSSGGGPPMGPMALTITALDAQHVAGTFTIPNPEDAGLLTGNFSVPMCSQNPGALCCYVEKAAPGGDGGALPAPDASIAPPDGGR
jgi:hypothetical protein